MSRGQALWLDCDTGLDDALALLAACRTPGVELRGVSTVAGNCPLEVATENTLRILELAGAGRTAVPPGAAAPLVAPAGDAREVHGTDGLGGLATQIPAARGRPRPESAAAALVRALRAQPGRIAVVATGPLTNLALAQALAPDVPRLARQLVVMGGAVGVPGNVGPACEFNFAADPEAAAAVLAAPWPIVQVGLDVTLQVRLGEAEAVALEAAPAGPGRSVPLFCAAALRAYAAAYTRQDGDGRAPMHDPLAVAVALDPSLVRAAQLPAAVETSGALTRGMLVADRRVLTRPSLLGGRRTIQCCLDVDVAAARSRLLSAWGAPPEG